MANKSTGGIFGSTPVEKIWSSINLRTFSPAPAMDNCSSKNIFSSVRNFSSFGGQYKSTSTRSGNTISILKKFLKIPAEIIVFVSSSNERMQASKINPNVQNV